MNISEAACMSCCIKETGIIQNTTIKEKATKNLAFIFKEFASGHLVSFHLCPAVIDLEELGI